MQFTIRGTCSNFFISLIQPKLQHTYMELPLFVLSFDLLPVPLILFVTVTFSLGRGT